MAKAAMVDVEPFIVKLKEAKTDLAAAINGGSNDEELSKVSEPCHRKV